MPTSTGGRLKLITAIKKIKCQVVEGENLFVNRLKFAKNPSDWTLIRNCCSSLQVFVLNERVYGIEKKLHRRFQQFTE